MSRHERSSNDPRITRIDLGDAVGDDDKLRAFLETMVVQVNKDAPDTAPMSKRNMWNLVRRAFVGTVGRTWQGLIWIKERFDNHVINQARADKMKPEAEAGKIRAEAAGTRKKDTAEADLIAADAELKRAEAEKVQAEAVAIRTDAQIKLIERLIAAGIDWQAEQDEDGHLNIVVTRRLPESSQ